MRSSGIFGIVLLSVGAILLAFAWRASQAPVDQVVETLTGRFTNETMWYIVGGAAALIAGVALTVMRPRA
ncbi:MAG: DUF3185 family protein [Alphaproteobacteria bacterium]